MQALFSFFTNSLYFKCRQGARFKRWYYRGKRNTRRIDAKTVLCLGSWKIIVPSKSMQIKMRTDVKTDTHFLYSKVL